ncbi:hypothetical protein F2P56_032078, partial [Juglans regia]
PVESDSDTSSHILSHESHHSSISHLYFILSKKYSVSTEYSQENSHPPNNPFSKPRPLSIFLFIKASNLIRKLSDPSSNEVYKVKQKKEYSANSFGLYFLFRNGGICQDKASN